MTILVPGKPALVFQHYSMKDIQLHELLPMALDGGIKSACSGCLTPRGNVDFVTRCNFQQMKGQLHYSTCLMKMGILNVSFFSHVVRNVTTTQVQKHVYTSKTNYTKGSHTLILRPPKIISNF
jgi:hypothetical protein